MSTTIRVSRDLLDWLEFNRNTGESREGTLVRLLGNPDFAADEWHRINEELGLEEAKKLRERLDDTIKRLEAAEGTAAEGEREMGLLPPGSNVFDPPSSGQFTIGNLTLQPPGHTPGNPPSETAPPVEAPPPKSTVGNLTGVEPERK